MSYVPSHRRAVSHLGLLLLALATPACAEPPRFTEDFSGDLSAWTLHGERSIAIVDSGDPSHGPALELRAEGLVYALVTGSEAWGPVRLESDIFFPDDGNNYLGLVYHHTETPGRSDFGLIYLKGNGSYLRANPFRDGNASRLLYEELRTSVTGDDAVRIGEWVRVAAEIQGHECHVYVGDMSTPKMTFDLYEGDAGAVGFQARIAGSPVWIDNVAVRSIAALSYSGPPIPDIAYDPTGLLTEWEVAGPLAAPSRAIESATVAESRHLPLWAPFETDRRGLVVSGRVTEYAGPRTVAYFRTSVEREAAGKAVLHLTTAEELALWVNGVFQGFVYRDGYLRPENDWNVWWDFRTNPEHAGSRVPIDLRVGENEILLRSRNGQFAAGGFFAAIE